MKTFKEFLFEKYIAESIEKPTPEELKRLGLKGSALIRYERGILRHSQNKSKESPKISTPKQILPVIKKSETEQITKRDIQLSTYQQEILDKQAKRRLANAELKFSKRK